MCPDGLSTLSTASPSPPPSTEVGRFFRPDLVYYLVYKPPGVISTADDPQGRPTVIDLVPPGFELRNRLRAQYAFLVAPSTEPES